MTSVQTDRKNGPVKVRYVAIHHVGVDTQLVAYMQQKRAREMVLVR